MERHVGQRKRTRDAAGRASLTYIDGTCVEMIRASTKRRTNTSGVLGVDWVPSKGLWRAMICFKGKRHYLGSYKKFDDAVEARRRGEEEYHQAFLREIDAANGHSGGQKGVGPLLNRKARRRKDLDNSFIWR